MGCIKYYPYKYKSLKLMQMSIIHLYVKQRAPLRCNYPRLFCPCFVAVAVPLASVYICEQARSLQGFWSELQWNTERTKYLNADPNPRYRTSHMQANWDKMVSVGVCACQNIPCTDWLLITHVSVCI